MKKVETAYRLWKELCGEDSPGASEVLEVLLGQCHAAVLRREQQTVEASAQSEELVEAPKKEHQEYRGFKLPHGVDRKEVLEALAALLKSHPDYDSLGCFIANQDVPCCPCVGVRCSECFCCSNCTSRHSREEKLSALVALMQEHGVDTAGIRVSDKYPSEETAEKAEKADEDAEKPAEFMGFLVPRETDEHLLENHKDYLNGADCWCAGVDCTYPEVRCENCILCKNYGDAQKKKSAYEAYYKKHTENN